MEPEDRQITQCYITDDTSDATLYREIEMQGDIRMELEMKDAIKMFEVTQT